jgi:transposase
MCAVLEEPGLAGLVTTIGGLTVTGAAAILAETGDPARFATPRALVGQAGLGPRGNSCGAAQGKAGLGDERGHIVEFTLDRVRLGVTALPAAAPVVVVDREMLRQLARQREIEAVISQRATDDDQRRAVAYLLVRDGRPVC